MESAQKLAVLLLTVSVVLSGCTSGEDSSPSTEQPLSEMALSVDQLPSAYSVNNTNESENFYTRSFASDNTGASVQSTIWRFENASVAQSAAQYSLQDLEPYRMDTDQGIIAVGGAMHSESTSVLVVLQNGRTLSTLSIVDAEQIGEEEIRELISDQANTMGISYDDEAVTSLIESRIPHGPNNPVEINDVEYVITDTSNLPAVGSGMMSTMADGTYLIVTLDVTNTGNDATTITSNRFKVRSGERTWEPDSEAMTLYSSMGQGIDRYNTFMLEEVGPGLTTTGSVVFDVPEDLDNARFAICSGGFSSECENVGIDP